MKRERPAPSRRTAPTPGPVAPPRPQPRLASLALALALTAALFLAVACPALAAPDTAPAPTDLDAPVQEGGARKTDPVLSEKNLLILNLAVDDMFLYEGMLGYDDGKQVFLPFETFVEAISFPITTSTDLQEATGWFLDEKNTFRLNRRAGQVEIAGTIHSFPAYQVRDDGFGLYVSTLLLAKWFPMEINVSLSKLRVTLKPSQPLPIQEKLARKHGRRTSKPGSYSVNLPLRGMDYEFFSLHGLDTNFSNNINKHENKDETTSTNRYALTYTGDLAFMSTKVYASGKDDTDDNYLETLRITGERVDPTGQMLGPLGATRVVLGDVDTVRFPGQGIRSNERGIYVENRALGSNNLYDTTTVVGDSLPGWDVELYHNQRLLGSVTVGDDGRYEFPDIQLYYGRNDIMLKFYGPQGQKRTETRTVDVGREMIAPGKLEYGLSLIQQNSQTITYKELPRGKDDNAVMGTALFSYGLADWASVFTGVNSIQLENERHNYVYLGTSLLGPDRLYFRADGLVDTYGGHKAQATLTKGFDFFSLNFKQESFFDDYDDQSLVASERLRHRTSAGLDFAGVSLTDDIGLGNNLGFVRTEYADRTDYTLGHTISALIAEDTHLSHGLSSTGTGKDVQEFKNITGSVLLRGDYEFENHPGLGRIELYSEMGYTLRPTVHLGYYDLRYTQRWSLTDHVGAFLSYRKQHDSEKDPYNAYGGGLDITLGSLVISPALSYSDAGYFEMNTNFNMSLGLDPRTGVPTPDERNMALSGGVSVRVFLDRNYNYVFDEGDEPLKRVFVKATQVGARERTDDSGVAALLGLPSYRPVDIEIDKGKDWNYFWSTVTEGDAVYVRPGKTYVLDYPVQVTSEIDGNVFLADGGTPVQVPNLPLELVDASGVIQATAKAAADGFYIFRQVRPGTYVVRPAPDYLMKHGLFAMPSPPVKVSGKGEIKSWTDLALYQSKSELIAASPKRFTERSPDLAVEKGFSAQSLSFGNARMGQAGQAGQDDGGFVAQKGFTSFTAAPATAFAAAAPGQAFGVHLASYVSEDNALAAIDGFKTESPELFADVNFRIVPVQVPDRGTFYRVIAGPLDRARALALGQTLRGRQVSAEVVEIPQS